jgi:predicted MPP superfamily phosphohydrolase
LITIILLLILLLGHTVLWVSADNRLHGTGLPRPAVKSLSTLLRVAYVALPIAFFVSEMNGQNISDAGAFAEATWGWKAYGIVCLAVAGTAPWHVARRLTIKDVPALVSNHVIRLYPAECDSIGAGKFNRLLMNLPANQCLRLEENQKTLELPELDPALDGFTIGHLSDLHFTGKIGRGFFDRAVDAVNAMQADVIAITGDLVDKDACIDWIPETLGRLRAPLGVYYVLGNHDLRVNLAKLRASLSSTQLIPLGGTSRTVEKQGKAIVLAGCELPWHRPTAAEETAVKTHSDQAALRILLAHTPDRFRWTRRQGFDLLLAGHTHGGQIQLPWLGPIVAPSVHGVKYASGVFQAGGTVMHVSRGVSGLHPLRWNCCPEITKLVLKAPLHRQA